MKYFFLLFFLVSCAGSADDSDEGFISDNGPPTPKTGSGVGNGSGPAGASACPAKVVDGKLIETCFVKRNLRPVFDMTRPAYAEDPPIYDFESKSSDVKTK